MSNHIEQVKHGTDVLAGITALGSFVDKLPEIAAGFAIIWYIIRMFEWASKKLKRRTCPQESDEP